MAVLGIDLPGVGDALAQLQFEWECPTCAICGTEKWPNYPFCRSCSIKLQRWRLMRDLMGGLPGLPLSEIMKTNWRTRTWAIRYDACRDFLFASKHDVVTFRRESD